MVAFVVSFVLVTVKVVPTGPVSGVGVLGAGAAVVAVIAAAVAAGADVDAAGLGAAAVLASRHGAGDPRREDQRGEPAAGDQQGVAGAVPRLGRDLADASTRSRTLSVVACYLTEVSVKPVPVRGPARVGGRETPGRHHRRHGAQVVRIRRVHHVHGLGSLKQRRSRRSSGYR